VQRKKIGWLKVKRRSLVNKLTAFFKKLRLRQILTVFLAGVLLIASTACSGANAQGANPNNPAVQAGGANNPYKSGGDNYTNLKMSTDPKVNTTKPNSQRDQANLELFSQQAIATNKDSGKLYPGAETPAGRAEKEAELPRKTLEELQQPEAGGLNQRNPDLGERIENRIEAVKDTFKDASVFVKDKADEAGQRPELQPNPGLRK
jgi:hypothetical protein